MADKLINISEEQYKCLKRYRRLAAAILSYTVNYKLFNEFYAAKETANIILYFKKNKAYYNEWFEKILDKQGKLDNPDIREEYIALNKNIIKKSIKQRRKQKKYHNMQYYINNYIDKVKNKYAYVA